MTDPNQQVGDTCVLPVVPDEPPRHLSDRALAGLWVAVVVPLAALAATATYSLSHQEPPAPRPPASVAPPVARPEPATRQAGVQRPRTGSPRPHRAPRRVVLAPPRMAKASPSPTAAGATPSPASPSPEPSPTPSPTPTPTPSSTETAAP